MSRKSSPEMARARDLYRQLKALPSTSARIRALHARGMSKTDIVKYLNAHFKERGRPHDFRYQHVHKILNQSAGGKKERAGVPAENSPKEPPDYLLVELRSAGRILIPPIFRDAMQVSKGDRLMARVVDGELRLIGAFMAIRQAQKMMRELIPKDDCPADVLAPDWGEEFKCETANAEPVLDDSAMTDLLARG